MIAIPGRALSPEEFAARVAIHLTSALTATAPMDLSTEEGRRAYARHLANNLLQTCTVLAHDPADLIAAERAGATR